jgi:hypothetical protein
LTKGRFDVIRRNVITAVLLAGILAAGGLFDGAQCQHRIGGGIHYLRTLGSIKDNPAWDPNSVGFMVSYQYVFGSVRLEGDLEWVPDFGGSDKTMFQPQAWLLLGKMIYLSAGIGGSYVDGDWFDNPFYGLRAGVNLTLIGLNFDGFTSYRFQSSNVFENVDEQDLDALTFGALVRVEF